MTKILMIMRHAKSSWSSAATKDHDRPLNNRGIRDAPFMAKYLAENGYRPDLIVSSTALRAKTTAEMFIANHPDLDCEFSLLQDLYHAPPDVYIDVLSQLKSDANTVMFVGHNPGLEYLTQQLSGEYHSMPTSATAIFRIEIEHWSDFDSTQTAKIELIDVLRPKELQ